MIDFIGRVKGLLKRPRRQIEAEAAGYRNIMSFLKEQRALFARCNKQYGYLRELLIVQEECEELGHAIAKVVRYGEKPELMENLAEEMADVLLVIEKAEQMLKLNNKVTGYYEAKLKRLEKRLSEPVKEIKWVKEGENG